MRKIIWLCLISLHAKFALATSCIMERKPSCDLLKVYSVTEIKPFSYESENYTLHTNVNCTVVLQALDEGSNYEISLPYCLSNKNKFYAILHEYRCPDGLMLSIYQRNNIEILSNKICNPKKEQQQLKFMQGNLVGKKVSELTKQGFFRISKKDKIWRYHAPVANSWDVEVSGEMCGNEICDDEAKQKIVSVKYKEDFIMLDDDGKLYYSSADSDKRHEYRPKPPEPKKKSLLEWLGF